MPSDEKERIAARSLAELRKDYSLAGLAEADAGSDPFALFHRWFDQAVAAELTDPNAMILATCTPDGSPSARAVNVPGAKPIANVRFSYAPSLSALLPLRLASTTTVILRSGS
ncbi:MAG: pyridoxamine 5'-phosphate oxidase family protein [Planctomycetes bacterium]|nr:pyridoxamine 5'-phosphate oxidase family protein [Planctomycetota bacterium]